MRKFFAILVIFSLMVLTSVAQTFSKNHSPGVQHELVMQMTMSADITPMFDFSRQATGYVVFGNAPTKNEGVTPEISPQCNSPGHTTL